MRRRHSGVVNLLVMVGALLVLIVLLEGGSRIFYLARWGRLYPIHEVQYSLRLGWEMAPGAYAAYTINAQGFRRPQDVSLRRPDDVIRIFLVGGSTAFGSNGLYPSIPPKPLAYEDLIDSHLQTLLQSRHPGRRFEVINAAVNEYRLFQEITVLREKLVNYQPHLVIFLDGHNDASSLTGGAAFRERPAPYWNSRHVERGQRVLNPSPLLGLLYYADVYLGRVSYFYHGLAVLLQRSMERSAERANASSRDESGEPFRLEDEPRLLERATARLRDLESTLPLYVAQVKDLKAVAAARGLPIVYALQPEIVVEDRARLTPMETQIQDLTFRVMESFGGTLSWRYLTRRIPAVLSALEAPDFLVVNLVTIADGSEQFYTDYAHLTSRGNRRVAESLSPIVAELLGLADQREAERLRAPPFPGPRDRRE